MDTKTLVAQTLLELKNGLGEVWDRITPEERQLAKDTAEELALASIEVLMGTPGAQDRVDRAKAGARAFAFGGALIAKGVFEEKLLAALGKAVQFLLGLALSKL